ncbi:MAG: hypothetical protein Q8L82_06655 [Nitrosomonas sp.]|nr:hypothetical protein [Nitrosomonas sp.]
MSASGWMQCKARGGVIASYGDDEQRRSVPARCDSSVTVIYERLLSVPCKACTIPPMELPDPGFKPFIDDKIANHT